MALGGALGLAWAPVTPRRFAWQAWHKLTPTVVLRGRRGTNSHPPSFCVAGVALMALGGALGLAWAPVTPRHFAWQAWHKLTPTVVLRGRRGTNSHPPSFCVAGVALMALGGALGLAWAPVTPRHFAWQAWHKLTPTFVSRGRRGTNSHLPSFHVAGVALMALGGALGLAWAPVTPRHFAWQAWHNLTSTFVSRGRRGTNSHPPSFHVAGVALMALGGALGLAWAPLRGRRGTNSHLLSVCVAGVAQTHIYLRFAWQAWHSWHWVARLDWLGRLWRCGTLRGRRGTNSHLLSVCVAGVAQTHIHRRFAWQAWHSWYCVARLVRICRQGRRGTLRGRRGTWWHPPSFQVAGVALTHIHRRFAWQAWHSWYCVARLVRICRQGRRGTLRGRRGTWWHPPSFHVAGVAQNSHPPSFCVAGVALMVLGGALGPDLSPGAPRHFAWQAWHLVTSTFVSRGRRGTNSHPLSFCVAGVALMVLGGALFVTPHLSYTIFHTSHCHTPSFTHHLSHTTLSHTIFDTPLCHTPLCHTPPFIHHLSHITLSHTFFHTPLCHIPSLTHRFVTPHLSYTTFHTSHCHTPSFTHHLSHTTLSHTIFDTPLCQPLCHTPPFIRHLSHITLSHTFFHTPLCHILSLTHRFVTHHFVTHHLSHTIFHTPLCHTPSFTHHFVTYHLWHTALSHTTLSHPTFHTPSFRHHIVTHLLSHTTLSHTIFDTPLCHTPLCHTPSFTHHLPHTTLSHAIFHTPSQTIFSHHLSHTIFHTTLCLAPSFTTPSFTHHFVTHHLSPHHLSHTTLSHTIFHRTIFNTTLSHTIFRQTIFHTPLCHTPSFPHNFVTRPLSHTTFAHTTLSHTLSFLVTHQLSHTTLSHTTLFYFSILHHLLCVSFLPRPRYNIWCLLFKEVVLWGYPVL